MPVKKSNKRAKLSASESTRPNQSYNVQASPLKREIQVAKALELPLELWIEITSYFLAVPIPAVSFGLLTPAFYHVLDAIYLERTEVLRALSQTCQLWRRIFLPLLYQRLEACATHSKSGAWYQVIGESLIRKSFLVNESQEIASNVRCMSVILSRYSTSTVLPAFVRAIEALPNLSTLQILSAHHQMTTALKTAFEGHRFPQIRTIVLPPQAHNILRSCPNVRKVISTAWQDASKLVSAIAKECKKVEEVEGFNGDERLMKRLVKAAPGLRSIKFTTVMYAESLRPLIALRNVSSITLQCARNSENEALNDPQTLSVIKVAKEIVKNFTGQRSILLEGRGYDYGRATAVYWCRAIGHDDR